MLILRNPLLVAFEAVHDHGTTHAAAKELAITQTAVTQRIKTLEHALSMTLFLRSRRGMRLTTEGEALLQYCRASRELEGQFLSQTQGKDRFEISLSVVGPTSAISTRVVSQVEHLYRKHPFLKLHLRSDDHSDLIELVRRGEADIALVPPSEVPNEMDSKQLKPDKFLLVASAKWRGRKLSEILASERIIDFYESDKTTEDYLSLFGLATEAKKNRLFVNENEALIRLFTAGVGFGTLTEGIAKPAIERGDLLALNRGQSMEFPLALAWYPRPAMPSYLKDLLRSIR